MKKPTDCGRFLSLDDIVKAKSYLDWLLDSGIIAYPEYQNMIMHVEVSADRGLNDTEQVDQTVGEG